MGLQLISKSMLAICATAIMFSCKKSVDEAPVTHRGQEVTMGNGKANSFITINSNGVPQELGIEMSQQALTGLTLNPTDFPNLSFVLPLDQKAKDLTAFDHLVIYWNPEGHPPANVFTLPHFDMNFYTITSAERMAIPPYTPATAPMFDNLPPAGFIPASHMVNPGGVPGLGKLWGDHHMQMPFTHTMIYGTYNGKISLVGPMITKAIIDAGTKVTAAFDQPQQFEKPGRYYPTKYNAYMDHATHKHYVTLSDFVLR